MKSGKATGPGDIASALWKAKSWDPTLWLSELFNRVIQEGRRPSDWQERTTVPIRKKNGSPAECSNYRPIRLLLHTMKIFERILDNGIREIVEITVNRARFVKNCGTQGSTLSPPLVLVKNTVTRGIQRPAPYTLIYSDDVFLASDSKNDLQQLVQKWNDRLMQHGLKLNLKKTEFLATDPHETGTITVSGSDLPRTERSKYFGSMLSANGELRYEIASRINVTWMKSRSTTGVLCDRLINEFTAISSALSPSMVRSVC